MGQCKRCEKAKRIGSANVRCRNCSQFFCEHLISYIDSAKTGMCASCQRMFAKAWQAEARKRVKGD